MEGRPSFWMFIGHLDDWTSEQTLSDYFSRFGVLQHWHIPSDSFRRRKGYAFISYPTEQMVDRVQAARPHYLDESPVITRRMAPPSTPFSRNLFLDQASSVVYIEGFPAYTSQGYLVAQLSLLGRIDDVAMAPPYYDEGMMKGSAYVYYDDYDSVDKALLTSFAFHGVPVTMLSEYQLQRRQLSSHDCYILDDPFVVQQPVMRAPVVQTPVERTLRPINTSNISFGKVANQNLGAARKAVKLSRAARTKTNIPTTSKRDEIDPIRGQLKRKRGMTTGSIPNAGAKRARLSSGLAPKTALERDCRMHRRLQAARLVANGQTMLQEMEDKMQALTVEEEEQKLKLAALESVSPVGKGLETGNTDREEGELEEGELDDENEEDEDSDIKPLDQSLKVADKSPKTVPTHPKTPPVPTHPKTPPVPSPVTPPAPLPAPHTMTCHVCDSVIDTTQPDPISPTGVRPEVEDNVAVLKRAIKVIHKKQKSLTRDLSGLRDALSAANKELSCPLCKKATLTYVYKCGHGTCQTCAVEEKVCRTCVASTRIKIPLKCGPGVRV